MPDDSQSLRTMLGDCLEAAQMLDTKLECEFSEAVETESEATNVDVRFAETGESEDSLNMRLLLDQLGASSTVAAIDLFGPPHARIVIHGARENHNYSIAIQL